MSNFLLVKKRVCGEEKIILLNVEHIVRIDYHPDEQGHPLYYTMTGGTGVWSHSPSFENLCNFYGVCDVDEVMSE